MYDKAKRKSLLRRIDEILFYLWDPIGVNEESCVREEYSSYALSIFNLVLLEDLEKIVDKLSEIETSQMGLIMNRVKNRAIAERLIRDKHAIDEGLS